MIAAPRPLLVVFNDSANLLRLFEAALSSPDLRVVTYPYDTDPTAVILIQRPSLVILGFSPYTLPRCLDVIHAMRRHAHMVDIPILLCTTMALTEVTTDLVTETEAVSVLRMPFVRDQLLEAVRAALSRPAWQG